MPTYIQKDTASDLSPSWPNAGIDHVLSTGTGTDTFIGIIVFASATLSKGFITLAGIPDNNAWEDGGIQTVEVELDTGDMDMRARCQVVKLSSTGTILESGAFTGYQTMSGGPFTFSPVAPTWAAAEACDNRYAIHFEFNETSGMGSASIDFAVGTTANEVVSDITENVSSCAVRIRDVIGLGVIPFQR